MSNQFTKGIVVSKDFVKSKISTTNSLLYITIRLVEPEMKPFRPGQFCTFRVAENIYRAYSIASDYKKFNEYKFLISVGHEGIGSNYFKNVEVGEEVFFLGPNGHFQVIVPVSSEIIICATGTGIAPFIPMVQFLIDNNCSSKIHCYHGIKDEANIEFYQKLHQTFQSQCPNYTSQMYISDPVLKENTIDYKKGRITDDVLKLDFSKHPNTHFYLCGHPDMVTQILEFLEEQNIPEKHIMTENFTSPGYQMKSFNL